MQYTTLQPISVHVMLLDDNSDDAMKLCRNLHQKAAGGLCCLLDTIDAKLIGNLSLGLPPQFTFFFRKRDAKREALVVAMVSACLVCVTCLLINLILVTTGLASQLQLVFILNPFAISMGLINTYVVTNVILQSKLGKHWAFALENDVAFCADESTLDYWHLSRIKWSPTFHHSDARTPFSVVRFRTRWSCCMCKLVLFRLPVTHVQHQTNLSSHIIALICDALHLAQPHAASQRALSILVLILPHHTTDAWTQQVKDTLTNANMWSECTPNGRVLVAATSITNIRWKPAGHDDWCHVVSFSEDDSVAHLELKLARF